MNRVILYPGSFDPVHIGHISVAIAAMNAISTDKLIFLLQRNIFKPETSMFTVATQVKFIRSITEKYINMDSVDVHNTSEQYLIDYLQYYWNRFGRSEDLYILIGDDTLHTLHKWKDIDSLYKDVTFIISPRTMSAADISTIVNTQLKINKWIVLKEVDTSLSSTDIRNYVYDMVLSYTGRL